MNSKSQKNDIPFFSIKSKDTESLEQENKAVDRVPWKEQSQEQRDLKRGEYEDGSERNWRQLTSKLRKAEKIGLIPPEICLKIVKELVHKENLIINFGIKFPSKINNFNKYLFGDIFKEGTELEQDTYDVLSSVRENAFWVCKYNSYLFGLNQAEEELGVGIGKEETETPLDYYLGQLDTSDKDFLKKE